MQNSGVYHKLNGVEIPEKLQVIDGAPKQLFYVGKNPNDLLSAPTVSIVGSRKPTPYGREVTHAIASELARLGVVIVSGLALGVDTIAHRACLEASGKTIAVLPCGPDKIYPATHREDARQIIKQGGALLTEYPPDTPPVRQNFIARNRLVSGLGDVVIVTEAAEKSGTLHTANFALNQSKTVMAVPGQINSALSKGTNNLIKAGALPITSVDDIIFELGLAKEQNKLFEPQNPQEKAVIDLLNQGVSDGHELLVKSGLQAAEFNETLTLLEINGQIKPMGNNTWALG